MRKTLLIDVPEKFDQPYLLQEKIFSFLEDRPVKYVTEYIILYRKDKESSKHIEKFISDWKLDCIGYQPKIDGYPSDSNVAKINTNKHMSSVTDEALIFFDSSKEDIDNKIMLDQCTNDFDCYVKVVRLDHNNQIY